MLKSESLLLVLLLATGSPPGPSEPQPPATTSQPAEALVLEPGSGSQPDVCRRHTPLRPAALPQPDPALYRQYATGTVAARWLRSLVHGGSSTGCSSSNCAGSIRRSKSASSSRGWGIWAATADLVDAGGVNLDASGFRGARQAVFVAGASSSSRGASVFLSSSSSSSSGGAATAATAEAGELASGTDAAGDGGDVCSDSCPLARNGICEDGSNIAMLGRDGGVQVACDFGTDCTDCGPYKGVVPTWGTEEGFAGPIDFLLRQNVKVYARRVAFEPHFLFAYTDPKEDLDVSEQIERAGGMELGILQIFREVLRERCAPFQHTAASAADAGGGQQQQQATPEALAPLVVDVGANFGFFSVYSAMLGCRVVAVEPVPRFLAFLHWNMAANGLRVVTVGSAATPTTAPRPDPTATGGASVVVVERVLSTASGQSMTMAAPLKGVWGTASIASSSNDMDQDVEMITVGSVQLDDIVDPKDQVILLKVDVEGYEPLVFRSGKRLISEQRVENILLEYSPASSLTIAAAGLPEGLERNLPDDSDIKLPVASEDPPQMLLDIINTGFTVVQLPDNFAKSGFLPQLEEAIPELQEVTARSLMYDLADLAWFRNFSIAGPSCPWPPELRLINDVAWGADGCLRPPEDSHPKGFRVMFSYNTNLWAARNRSAFKISGPVGLFAPDEDEAKSWWSQRNAGKGVGNRACEYLPAGLMLRSRCPCSKPDLCSMEQEAVLKALAEGRMPLRPLPPPS